MLEAGPYDMRAIQWGIELPKAISAALSCTPRIIVLKIPKLGCIAGRYRPAKTNMRMSKAQAMPTSRLANTPATTR